MNDITKKYSNDEVTIVWRPAKCIHSKICWNSNGLPDVFNPREKPWIKPEAADSEALIAQVDKCPSGALTWFRNNDPEGSNIVVNESTEVTVTPNGPLMVHGDLTVKHADGSISTEQKVTAFCRCGQSSNKPYCDGTHRKINFTDV